MTPQFRTYFIYGFLGGLAFAGAPLYFNIRYDLPLYFILKWVGNFAQCIGNACWPYIILSIILSAVVWGVVIAVIAYFVPKSLPDTEENQSGENAEDDKISY